jgi:1,4-alpha-glucan branching enzyme
MVELAHSIEPEYGDYWHTQVNMLTHPKPHPDSAWGKPGRYIYRYQLQNPNHKAPIDWIIDPFAREFGVGKLSAFTLGYQPYTWNNNETTWKTPPLADLVFYELMITEFGGDIDRTILQLDYLADLGINGIEVMPLSNVANIVDWGFCPVGYFGVDERFGKRRDMQRLIDAAHQRGIAVIVDSVYGHTSDSFPYSYVYRKLGYHENPFMGSFAKDYFAESTNFKRPFVQDFFFTVNHHWLDCYHVDGFRYDCVPNYWDGPTGCGYAALVYESYQSVKAKAGSTEHWQRFFSSGAMNLIQCAEQLEGPVEILEKTYSNCTWQNGTLGSAKAVAQGCRDAVEGLGLQLGLCGYPETVTNSGDTIPKTALQYVENHDHSRFVCNFGRIARDNDLLQEGNRDLWFKVQPYLIALMTSKGIPLIWQGQELGENYYVPDGGWGRVLLFRPVRWDYFYDSIGKSMVSLTRKLVRLRRDRTEFRRGQHYFYNHFDHYQSKNVLLFSRQCGSNFSLVALNFGDQQQSVPFTFPVGGDFQEALHGDEDGQLNLKGIASGDDLWLTVPSNYGRVWTSRVTP